MEHPQFDIQHLSTTVFNKENISILGIPTKNRPDSLKKLLASFKKDHFKDFNGSIVIIDTSSPEYAEAYKNIIDEARHRLECSVIYKQPDDIRKTLKYISEHVSISLEDLEICFLGHKDSFNAGAIRNNFLLFQGNKTGIQMDDDIILEYKKTKTYGKKTVLTLQQPITIKTSVSEEKNNSHLETIESNPLMIYEDFFKSNPFGSENTEIGSVNDILRNRIGHSKSHIISIQNGLYGDPAAQRFPALQENLTESEYTQLKNSRHTIQSPSSPTLTDNPLCIAAYRATRGDVLSPPFPPLGRAEDFLVGVITSQFCVGSLSLHLGELVHHKRTDILPTPKLSSLALPNSNRIFAGILARHVYSGSTEENFRELGSCMQNFTSLPQTAFQEFIIKHCKEEWAASRDSLEKILSESLLTPDMQSDIRMYRDDLNDSINASTVDIVDRVGDNTLWYTIQQGYRAYGKLLQVWSEIRTLSKNKNLLLH